MSTKLYLRSAWVDAAPTANKAGNGIAYVCLNGANGSWWNHWLSTSPGSAADSIIQAQSVAGPTNGVEFDGGVLPNGGELWVSAPLAADVTISGSITFNVWAYESSMSANVAINCRLMKMSAIDGTLTEFHKTVRVTEIAESTHAVNAWSETPSSYAIHKGDRIVVVPFGDDAGTMTGSYYFFISVNSPSSNVEGDSFVTFTETFSFDDTTPSGTSVWLTDASAGIDPGSASELLAWTSRGGDVSTATTNTSAGPVSPIQVKLSGTAIEWYTPPLLATTLSGPVLVNLWASETSNSANCTTRCEIAICAGNGTSPVIWGMGGGGSGGIELALSSSSGAFFVDGEDASITLGQRLRIRVYIDDSYGGVSTPMANGYSASVYFNGGTPSASGDSYLTFPFTLTEAAVTGDFSTSAYIAAQPPAPIAAFFIGSSL